MERSATLALGDDGGGVEAWTAAVAGGDEGERGGDARRLVTNSRRATARMWRACWAGTSTREQRDDALVERAHDELRQPRRAAPHGAASGGHGRDAAASGLPDRGRRVRASAARAACAVELLAWQTCGPCRVEGARSMLIACRAALSGLLCAAWGSREVSRTSSPTTQSTFGGRAAQAARSALAAAVRRRRAGAGRRCVRRCRTWAGRCGGRRCSSPSGGIACAGRRGGLSTSHSATDSPRRNPTASAPDEPHRRESPRKLAPTASKAQRYGDKQV